LAGLLSICDDCFKGRNLVINKKYLPMTAQENSAA
jgi:hypothetical protein